MSDEPMRRVGSLLADIPVTLVFDVDVLSLQPGDVIVISTKNSLTVDAVEALRTALKRNFPGHKIMLLGEEIRLDVERPDKADL